MWAALWSELTAPLAAANSPEAVAGAILRWLEFHSPGHHDDRTMALATPALNDTDGFFKDLNFYPRYAFDRG